MNKIAIILTLSIISMISCSKEQIEGCTNNIAINFDAKAEKDDGSCM
ncbi:hypothetical protein N9242_05490 [Vicingaceae bacterium]|jgi:hypothetical protein|nr:hypothetical protein [Vicingaceae bacterium]